MKIPSATAKILGVFNSLSAAQHVAPRSDWLWLRRYGKQTKTTICVYIIM